MFGFFIGTLCLFGLAHMLGRHHHHHHPSRGHRGCGPRGHHGDHHADHYGPPGRGFGPPRHRRGRRGGRDRAMLETLKRRLDLDEDQEDLFDYAAKDFRAARKELHEALKTTREEVAEAFVEETLEEGRLAAILSNQEDSIKRARKNAVSALRQIHATLDPDQRERAAELFARGRRA